MTELETPVTKEELLRLKDMASKAKPFTGYEWLHDDERSERSQANQELFAFAQKVIPALVDEVLDLRMVT